MRTKILAFACVLLAGIALNNTTSVVRAEETVTTGSAIETKDKEESIGEKDTLSEEKDADTGAKKEEEIEVEEDETPRGETEDKKVVSNKKNNKKTVKKAVKTAKVHKLTKDDKVTKVEKKTKDVIKYTDEEFKILVCVTFLEAGNQSYKGKLATANAVINRVLSKKFPNSIKSVVYQKYAGRYQFALCAPGGKLDQAMRNYGKNTGWRAAYEKACIKVCKDALAGKTATDRKYHFFRLHYKGIENWKSDGVKIDDTYYYNY